MHSANRTGSEREAALECLGRLLEPVAELLLELGVTSVEAESVMRDTVIRSANRLVTEETGRSKASLVALRCGLYRGEIRKRLARLSGSAGDSPVVAPEPHRLNRLLTGWHGDPEFTNSEGRPRDLPIAGKRSFESLSQRYAANLYPSIVLHELERVGAVVRVSGRRVRVLHEEFRTRDLSEDRLHQLGSHARDLVRALIGGVRQGTDESLFVVAEGFDIDPRYLPLLRKTVRARSKAFIKLVEEQLNDEGRRVSEGGSRVSVALIGTHGFESTSAVAKERARNRRKPASRPNTRPTQRREES